MNALFLKGRIQQIFRYFAQSAGVQTRLRIVLYYDVHTHSPGASANMLSILNVHERFTDAGNGALCSMGLHPWYLQNFEQAYHELEQAAAASNVLAIGECGLDKVCTTNWELQCQAFGAQLQLAGKLRKPLVIHCVRAYEEVAAMITGYNVTVPVIFHGYNKKTQVASMLLRKGFYLSFGAAILQDSPASDVLAGIDEGRYLLETDNADVPITAIYERAAQIRKTTQDAVILQLGNNFKKVFNR